MAAVECETKDNYHSVARQCHTVVRATQQVNGKWQFWGCQNSVTPEPIDQKFDIRIYVGEVTSYAKFH